MKDPTKIRANLSHPIVDADAHCLELLPHAYEYVAKQGGAATVQRLQEFVRMVNSWYELSWEQRRARWAVRPPWGLINNDRDLATCMFPRLFASRMDEMGLDVSIVYPTAGLLLARHPDPETRQAAVRGLNEYYRDIHAEVSDRMIPAALVPMATPDEAIEVLEHAAETLGMKTVVIDCVTRRPIKDLEEIREKVRPDLRRHLTHLESFGLDSEYDYDPFWRRCLDLKVSVAGHQSGHWGHRTSISNYIHNHLGLFGEGGQSLCKSLFFGGVTRRFPELRIAFLEGGAAWAASLLGDLREHFEKRNADAIRRTPVDEGMIKALAAEWAGAGARPHMEKPLAESWADLYRIAGWVDSPDALQDDFEAIGVKTVEELEKLFIEPFFFGCEGDDSSVGWAMSDLVSQPPLQAIFGSDAGHWDVPDLGGIFEETYELVEDGILDEAAFARFTFENAVRFHGAANPNFFDGTAVEDAARKILSPVEK